MGSISLTQITIQLGLIMTRVGWSPLVASMAFVVAAFLIQVAEPHLRQQTRALEKHWATILREAQPPTPVTDLHAVYSQFRAHLPIEEKQEEILKSLLETAAEIGITINQADYDRQSDTDCDCIKLHIVMPLKGTYPQIRSFIDRALNRIATLALESLTLSRESVKSADLEARLRFTLYLRPQE